jgi:nickel/cobalt exporter
MLENILYLASSFWLGAVHATTPGHGKTIAASYIVGARGRPIDALVLWIFVTLAHTSGIVLVAVLATLGSAWLIPRRVEAYLALATGVLVIAIGGWMLRTQWRLLSAARARGNAGSAGGDARAPAGASPYGHGPTHGPPDHELHAHPHPHEHGPHTHSHGWGGAHTHDLESLAQTRPRLAVLLGLGIAGGLLPDPGALAILLAAIADGRLVVGLMTVVVFSLGFASVLVVVGVVAARAGELILAWLSSRWIVWVQIGASLLIVGVGLVLTANAVQTVAAVR